MTVVVAFVGPDGAVMASDTEGTESGHTRLDVEKIWPVAGLLLGYSGTGSVRQPLQVSIAGQVEAVFGNAPEIDRWEAKSALRAASLPVLKEAYENFVTPDPATPAGHVLGGTLLVAGRDTNGYWLLEIDAHNQGTFYEQAGFHTIGSGSSAAYVAQALMKGYEPAGRSLSHLKLIAFRTVDTCINTLGGPFGVGGSVDLWASKDSGPFERAPDAECARIAAGVEQWTTIERESLQQVVLDAVPEGAPEPKPEAELPEPVEDGDEPAVGLPE